MMAQEVRHLGAGGGWRGVESSCWSKAYREADKLSGKENQPSFGGGGGRERMIDGGAGKERTQGK